MNLKDLKKKGGFVSSAPVAKTVTWKRIDESGEKVSDEFVIHVRLWSFGLVEEMRSVKEGSLTHEKTSHYISRSLLLGDDGDEEISYEDAYQLDPSLAGVFISAIYEVNGLVRKEPKKSQPPMSSGASSSSTELAAQQ